MRPGGRTRAPNRSPSMTDLVFLALGAGLFGALVAYTLLCARL